MPTSSATALRRLAAALPHGRSLPEVQWCARHRGMLWLLWAHVPGLAVVGLLYGLPLWHALADVAAPAGFALLATVRQGGRRAQALAVVLGLLTCSAVLVHITGGLIEAHFHYFVMVAVVSLYEDWMVFLVAVAFVLLQHGAMAAFVDHDSVFDHPGSSWKWAGIHSAFIAALSLACLVNWRASERQRATTQALVDSLAEGVLMIGGDGRPLAANPSARRLLGFDPAALAAANGSDPRWTMLRPDGTPLPEDERPVRRVAATGEPCPNVLVGVRGAEGDVRWLTLSAQPVRGGDGVVVSFADVTEEREARTQLERSNAELQQFAYVASHDLSEPLRMVSSYLQLLRRRYHGQLDGDADEFIDYAVDGAGRMRRLIDDLLTYSRAGRVDRPLEQVSTGVVARRVADDLRGHEGPHAPVVRIEELPTVMGDERQLGQLFQNLIGNALKFVPADRVPEVAVSATRDGDEWRFSVEDNGIGLDAGHAERIFRMFQRLHSRDEYPGTGIGLAIAKKVVERHGGRIWAEPRPEGGARFSFTLQAAPWALR
jgi:PAS domain S-box-containing protein